MRKKQFNIGKTIKVIALSLMTGLLCFSCTKEPLPQDPNGTGGSSSGEEGLLSLSLKIDATTKADTERGTDAENTVKNIRVILYALDGIVDKAEYIFDYDLTKPAPDETESELLTNTSPYQTKAEKVKRKDYRLVVLVNYFNPDITATKNILADATAIPRHPITVVTNPIDYYALSSATAWKAKAFNFLTGYDDSTPVTGTTAPEAGLFFMSNANNVAEIKANMICMSETLAEAQPVVIKVERGVAKVSVSEGAQLTSNLPAGASLLDFSWRVDIMNMQMYPLRRPTYMAPYGAGKGAMETSGTSAKDRYAQDPNFDNVSQSRIASDSRGALDANFEYIKDGLDARGKEYFGQLVMAKGGVINTNNYEYVLENTMEAAEQYEDVTTRILFRGNYVPPPTTLPDYNPPTVEMVSSASNVRATPGSAQTRATVANPDGSVTATFAPGESYFSYNGVAFSAEQMRLMYEHPGFAPNNGRIPNDIRLRGLLDIFSRQVLNPDYGNTAKNFNIHFSPGNPYFDENLGWGDEMPNGIPNFPWNQNFFEEFGNNVGNDIVVRSSDLPPAALDYLSSIPPSGSHYYYYNYWSDYDYENWIEHMFIYDDEDKYTPGSPGFTNSFTPIIDNPLPEQFEAEFPWIWDESEPEVAKSWKGINYHAGGISYYSTPIRHFSDVQSPLRMGYGRYGVVRNNHYKIVVDNIKGPGSPVILAPRGEDDANKWISVSVEVVPWLMRTQTMPLQ